MEKIDLHIHTNCSDGSYDFKQIIDMAVIYNIKTISITDHDTIDAYTKENIEYAKKNNINLIYGVEISTKINKCGIHILGYNIDINNQDLIDKLYLLKNSRHIYLKEVTDILNKLGYTVNYEKLDKIKLVTKAHIADDIVNNPINKNKLIKVFGFIPDKGLFIETVMNEGKDAYVEKKSISIKEASDIIKKSGGKVILAHPVAYKYEDNLTEDDILNIVLENELNGIESNYIYVNKDNEIINEIDKWNLFAKKHNLITTVGSDFHKIDELRPNIGSINVENINKILDDLNEVK